MSKLDCCAKSMFCVTIVHEIEVFGLGSFSDLISLLLCFCWAVIDLFVRILS